MIEEKREIYNGIEFVLQVKHGVRKLGWQWTVNVIDCGRLRHAYGPVSYVTAKWPQQCAGYCPEFAEEPARISDGFARARQWVRRHASEYAWIKQRDPDDPQQVFEEREWREELGGREFIYRVMPGLNNRGWQWSVLVVKNEQEDELLFGPVNYITEPSQLEVSRDSAACNTVEVQFVDGFSRAQAWAHNSLRKYVILE